MKELLRKAFEAGELKHKVRDFESVEDFEEWYEQNKPDDRIKDFMEFVYENARFDGDLNETFANHYMNLLKELE